MAILGAAALVAVALSAMPAIGAKKPLTKKKAVALFYPRSEADAAFLDQSEGDARYLDQAGGDARYQRQGNIVISHNGQWSINDDGGAGTVLDFLGEVEIDSNTTTTIHAQLHLAGPVNLGMGTYGLQNVRVCYQQVSGGGSADKIDETDVYEQNLGTPPNPLNDATDRVSATAECYNATLGTPYTPTDTGSLVLVLEFDPDHVDDALHIGGITTTWVRTGPAPG